MKNFYLFLILLFISSFIQAQQKINYAYDLPCYSYKIDTPITKFITSAAFYEFINHVEQDINHTLQTYQIDDFTTLSNYYLTLSQINILKGNNKQALDFIKKAEAIQWKDSYKQCIGLLYKSIASAEQNKNITESSFEKELKNKLKNIEWKTAHDLIERQHYLYLVLTEKKLDKELMKFTYQMNYNQQIPNTIAFELIRKAVDKKYISIIEKKYAPTLASYLKKNKPSDINYYIGCNQNNFPSEVDQTKLNPVLTSYIDTGTDTTLFKSNQLYKNSLDPIDGKDNDKNGYVDDYMGIQYDSINIHSKSPFTFIDIGKDQTHFHKLRKGIFDLRIFHQTAEAEYATTNYIKNKNDRENSLIDYKLFKFLDASHGTGTASIILRNNPTAQLITNKIFTYYDIDCTDFNSFNAWIESLDKMVRYSKEKGARVINISLNMNFDWMVQFFYC